MKQAELQQFLTEFAADRVMLVQRHEAGASLVALEERHALGRELGENVLEFGLLHDCVTPSAFPCR